MQLLRSITLFVRVAVMRRPATKSQVVGQREIHVKDFLQMRSQTIKYFTSCKKLNCDKHQSIQIFQSCCCLTRAKNTNIYLCIDRYFVY